MSKHLINIAVITALIMTLAVPGFSYAEEPGGFVVERDSQATEVIVAESDEDVISAVNTEEAEPFFTIDVTREETAGSIADPETAKIVEEIISDDNNGSKEEEVVQTLDETGLYDAQTGEENSVDVTSKYAYRRLILEAEQRDEIDAYGAKEAVYYDGCYYLTYESEEATKAAYDALCAEYGCEAVLNDWPLKSTAQSWGTKYMAMDQEMAKAKSGGQVTVAVMDTGIDRTHSIFKGTTVLQGYDYVNKDNSPADDNGHGTMVAGIIAESTPSNVRILPIKVLDAKGEGSLSNMLLALQRAETEGASIANMSFGYSLSTSAYGTQISNLESRFENRDLFMVAASGNENVNLDADGKTLIPGELRSVSCVGSFSVNDLGEMHSKFSNYGKNIDFAAPGEEIMVAVKGNNTYRSQNGTSFSSPHIAAAAAVIKAERMMFTRADIKDALIHISKDIGSKGKDVYFGYGCPAFANVDIKQLKASLLNTSLAIKIPSQVKTYTGKPIRQNITVRTAYTTLRSGTDYTLTYWNNKAVGIAKVTIAGKNNYKRSITRSFRIIPKGTKIKKLKKARNAIKVNWTRQSAKMPTKRVTGYQVQTAVNKKFTRNLKTKKIKGYKKTSTKIVNLKANKKYYVRVRTYMRTGGKTYYSNWSKIKAIRTR